VYASLEPCALEGRTPACVDALLAAGVARVVAAARDPNPAQAGGLERLRAAGVEVGLATGELAFRARAQNDAWRTWVAAYRPFVRYKAAVSLDGRVTVPGERWVSGEESRRLVHELRAAADAVAVGTGTFLADSPRLDARGVDATRQPRRLVFGRRPLPPGSELELVTEPLPEALARLAREGVQSLLLEGGPTLAAAFLEADLVDELLLFVAPTLAGAGPGLLTALSGPRRLSRLTSRAVGDDVLLCAYVHEP
jgi:diaminohydroxyphosphoribosylaminopyrimidine deaminase/5-amino-6-(5-phosphoribosylamino)uracil reductase